MAIKIAKTEGCRDHNIVCIVRAQNVHLVKFASSTIIVVPFDFSVHTKTTERLIKI